MIPSLFRSCLIVLLAMSGLDAAELPKKAPLSRYQSLWQNSPFTTPPKQEVGAPLPDVFGDWALKGIAPIGSGYLITLINRKNPAEPVPSIDTDRPSEFTIDRIERNPDKPLDTVVYLSKGTQKGSIRYDEKLSTIKPAAVKPGQHPPGQPPVPGQPPQVKQPTPPNPPGAVRQPRPRVVPPPTPTAAPTAPGTKPNSGGNPPRQRPSYR
ncbi:MAG: hypothetical protein WCP45_01685 [Verrucomicrobiota bacterium]